MAYSINSKCICCRMCEAHCPTEAIYYRGATFGIDPNRCVECGTCLTYCNSNAITTGQERQKTEILHEEPLLACDLTVIGAGGAGLITAVRFAEQTGKRVILLEKAENVGGQCMVCSWNDDPGIRAGAVSGRSGYAGADESTGSFRK